MCVVKQWLSNGGEVREGLRLLSIYAPNPPLAWLVEHAPQTYSCLLAKVLGPFAERERDDGTVAGTSCTDAGQCAGQAPYPAGSFRREWPFLADPGCPMELKILAADKITAYHNYVSAHARLSSCTTPEECFGCAKKVMENYKANRKILSELVYYREHGKVLGRHEIFSETRRLKALRNLSIVELLKRQSNLEESLWRIDYEMRKGDKPWLSEERQKRMDAKKRELAEVKDIINGYGRQ